MTPLKTLSDLSLYLAENTDRNRPHVEWKPCDDKIKADEMV